MGKRKRIVKEIIGEIVVDEKAYSSNLGSLNARKAIEHSAQIHIEVWYDKHYINRLNFGDEEGKRNGIEEEHILQLVSHSLGHLIHYSLLIKNFSFVSSKHHNIHSQRVVLQAQTEIGLLNVVVPFYHINENRYEATVYTAMVEDHFRIGDGQYALKIDGNDSTLFKMDNKRLLQVNTNP